MTEQYPHPTEKSLRAEHYAPFTPTAEKAAAPEGETALSPEVLATARTFAEYFKQGEMSTAEFGHATGKLLIDQLRALNLPATPRAERAAKVAELRETFQYYQEIFGPDDFAKYRNGFLAEYAASYCLAEQVGYEVFEAQPEEDLHHKVDLWVELEDKPGELPKNVVALQTKCMDTPREYLYLINTREDVEALVTYLLPTVPEGLSVDDFIRQGERMLEYTKQFDNVQAAYLILPWPGGEKAKFNIQTGEPDARLSEELYDEINRKLLIYQEA